MPTPTEYWKPSEPSDPNAEYMTVQETAFVLKCSVRWLREGCNKQGFPHSRQGRRIVTNRADRAAIYERMRRGSTRRVPRQRSAA